MQQFDGDIIYCDEPWCKEPQKIISSNEQHFRDHNGHKIRMISELKAQLLNKDDQGNPQKPLIMNNKENLMSLIDDKIMILTKLFNQTMLEFSSRLKSYNIHSIYRFVDDSLVSMSNIPLLIQAILDNNVENIYLYQNELEYLKKDSEFFYQQVMFSEEVQEKLQQTFDLTEDKIQELDHFNIFKWSLLDKHQSIIIDELSAENLSSGINHVLLDPQFNFQQSGTILLQVTKMSHYSCIFQICDLNVVRFQKLNFSDNVEEGVCSNSDFSDGSILDRNSYEQEKDIGFNYEVDDILELHYDGPMKTFTTKNKSSGEEYQFKVTFAKDAEIYFGVDFYYECSFEII